MEWVTGILFCCPMGERGNLSRHFFFWNPDSLTTIPSNDVIEIHVWEKHLNYLSITYCSFYTIPLDFVDRMGERIPAIDISSELEDLGEMYGSEW